MCATRVGFLRFACSVFEKLLRDNAARRKRRGAAVATGSIDLLTATALGGRRYDAPVMREDALGEVLGAISLSVRV